MARCSRPPPTPNPLILATPRQLLCVGKPNGEIAATLYISENVVEGHLKNIYRKLGVKSRVEAILVASQKDYRKP